jgi:hypothetical protein
MTKLKLARLEGQSSDGKPLKYAGGDTPVGAEYHEIDTGRNFKFDGLKWNELYKSDEGKNWASKQPRSSLIQLFGDEFAQVGASAVFTLENLDDLQGGTGLTNVGNIDLNRTEDKLPLRGYKVPTFNGTDQYFSIPTESKVEVGTNSFIGKIDFITTKSGIQTMVSYGDSQASEQHWRIRQDGAGQDTLLFTIDDGTNSTGASVLNISRFHDGKPHTMVFFADRTNNFLYVFVDGKFEASTSSASVTGTLNNVGTNLQIGAGNNAGVTDEYTGELSNFQLYQDADANKLFNLIPILSNPQLRKSPYKNNGTLVTGNNASSRINNDFGFGGSPNIGDYTTCIINTSEGIYDIIDLYGTATNHGVFDFKIDGKVVATEDHEAGSTVWSVSNTTKGIYISEGSHIFEIAVSADGTLNNRSNHAMIELIKRDGNYNESDEATSGILFGDELLQKETLAGSLGIDTSNVYNNQYTDATTANGEFMEGTIFIKKGLYKITMTAQGSIDYPAIDLTFGGVKVLDADTSFDVATANLQVTKFAFLEGGKTPVRLTINSTTTGDALEWTSIRFELVDGKGNGDVVDIWAGDNDFESVNGNSPTTLDINTGDRFSGRRRISASPADNDEYLYRRYFSGGTYLVDLMYIQAATTGAILDVAWDSPAGNNIFDNLDTSGTTTSNIHAFTVVNIPRGFHDIHYTVDDATKVNFRLQRNTFTKIGENPDAQNDDNSDGVHGSLVPLGRYFARQEESDADMLIASLDLGGKDYSAIKVVVGGLMSDTIVGSPDLKISINSVGGTSYEMDGYEMRTGTETIRNSNSGGFILHDNNSLATAGVRFVADVTIIYTSARYNMISTGHSGNSTNGAFTTVGCLVNNASATNPLQRVRVFLTADNWKVGAYVNVYGVKA